MARPSKYRSEFAEQARKLCRLGATDKEISEFFGIGEATLNRWKNDHPEFRESLKSGKALADAEVADKLFKRATGYSHDAVKIFNDEGVPLIVPYTENYPPDTTAAIFWLKNRRPDLWRDKVQQEVTGPDGGALLQNIKVIFGDD
jgi:transcriptional regulator with XRE-family HTH domain